MLNRFLCSLLALVSCAFAQNVTFPAGADHVTVPFTDHRNHMVIQVGLNGTAPQPAVLDTGAHGAVLNGDATTVQKLGIKETHDAEIRGAGGKGVSLKAVVASDIVFDIGGAKLSGNTLAIGENVVPPGHVAQLVVGRSVFTNFIVKVDWEKMELTLYDPAKFHYTGNGTALSLEFDPHGIPYVQAKVSTADIKDVPVKLVLDSGGSHALSLLYGGSSPFKEPVNVEKRVIGRGASGEVSGYIIPTPSFILAGYSFANVPTVYPDESYGPVRNDGNQQGNLGAGILRRFTITYDYQHQCIYLEPNSHFADEFKPLPPLKK
jgi:hypothetical protein